MESDLKGHLFDVIKVVQEAKTKTSDYSEHCKQVVNKFRGDVLFFYNLQYCISHLNCNAL
ncbi:hypothetical protein J6590_089658, partial [Homalodisca vitripennis]